MKTKIIIGLGYGDEGKGLTTDYLCRQFKNPLVIRFSGGHQAGHTVVTEKGERHVFSSFGSGTFRGTPTYWSKYCTLYPIALNNEHKAIRKLGIEPELFVDALSMITTPYDIYYNRITERSNLHGSCGVGFGATVERNEGPYKLYALDLCYPTVFHKKLAAVKTYYEVRKQATFEGEEFEKVLKEFLEACEHIRSFIQVVHEQSFFTKLALSEVEGVKYKNLYDVLIFEGSQGILLDQDFGFFPNVTRAHVTSRNAMKIISTCNLPQPEIYYVTRAYQTRHGNGFLSNENIPLDFNPNPLETNQYNEWQGEQRIAPLDIDLLNYALECDSNYSMPFGKFLKKHLVVTCMDQIINGIAATEQRDLKYFAKAEELAKRLCIDFESALESWSDCSDGMIDTFRKKNPLRKVS